MDDTTFTHKETSVLNLFNSTPYKTINTLQFNEAGFIHAAKEISKLRRKGAVIVVSFKTATDSFNNTLPRIAHYKFKGWALQPLSSRKSSATKK